MKNYTMGRGFTYSLLNVHFNVIAMLFYEGNYTKHGMFYLWHFLTLHSQQINKHIFAILKMCWKSITMENQLFNCLSMKMRIKTYQPKNFSTNWNNTKFYIKKSIVVSTHTQLLVQNQLIDLCECVCVCVCVWIGKWMRKLAI